MWNLSVSPDSLLMLTFSVFNLEPRVDCDYYDYYYGLGRLHEYYYYEDYYCSEECLDYVEVSFGSYNEKFCGSEFPGTITSTDNTMTVKFYSDYSVDYQGFSANWEAVSLEMDMLPLSSSRPSCTCGVKKELHSAVRRSKSKIIYRSKSKIIGGTVVDPVSCMLLLATGGFLKLHP